MTRVRIVNTTDAVRRALRRAAFKNLGHAGASLRLAAQRMIRTRKASSEPGSPPNTRKGALRRSILYAVEGATGVVIGPSANLISDVARVHEHGGRQRPRSLQGKTTDTILTAGTNWKLEVGGHGPIAYKDGTAYIRFVSKAQVLKAERYIADAPPEAFGNTKKARDAAKKRQIQAQVALAGGVATYPQRPFMGPTLMKNLDRLPNVWAASVH